MKFSCLQENLNKGLLIVSHLSSKNINLPILNNVLIKIEDKTLKLFSTNLEIALSCAIRGKIEETGNFTVPARLLSDYISLLPNLKVDIEKKEQFLEIKCGNFQTKIKGINASDFPLIPKIEKEISYFIEPELFKKAVSQVIFAVSPGESRPEISGVLFNFNSEKNQELILTATDSYRLTEKKISLINQKEQTSSFEKKSLIVPQKTLIEILHILSVLGDEEEENKILEISVSENQIIFSFNNAKLISRLIASQYPDYKQIIPKDFKTEVKLDKEIFLKAVKSAGLFSKTGINDIHLEFKAQKNEIRVASSDSQTGEHEVILEGDIKGEDNSIVLNFRYLLDGLNSISDEKISIKVIDENNPCLFASSNENDYFYIIMPIKQ